MPLKSVFTRSSSISHYFDRSVRWEIDFQIEKISPVQSVPTPEFLSPEFVITSFGASELWFDFWLYFRNFQFIYFFFYRKLRFCPISDVQPLEGFNCCMSFHAMPVSNRFTGSDFHFTLVSENGSLLHKRSYLGDKSKKVERGQWFGFNNFASIPLIQKHLGHSKKMYLEFYFAGWGFQYRKDA